MQATVAAKVPADIVKKLEAAAEIMGTSKSELVRRAVTATAKAIEEAAPWKAKLAILGSFVVSLPAGFEKTYKTEIAEEWYEPGDWERQFAYEVGFSEDEVVAFRERYVYFVRVIRREESGAIYVSWKKYHDLKNKDGKVGSTKFSEGFWRSSIDVCGDGTVRVSGGTISERELDIILKAIGL